MKTFKQIILQEKTFQDISKSEKNIWVRIPLTDLMIDDDGIIPEINKELFELIDKSYAYIGGHANIPDPRFIPGKEELWKAIDIDDDPEPDIVKFGKKSKFGNKWTGGATDLSDDAKKQYIAYTIEVLKNEGNYVEASDKMAHILIKNKIPCIDNKEIVEMILNKSVKWIGAKEDGRYPEYNGWYRRILNDGKEHEKILLGKPNI